MSDIICQRCGSVNDYREEIKGPHKTAICNGCDRYIKHLSQGNPTVLYFGKYKGRELSSLTSDEEKRYLEWLSGTNIKAGLKEAIVNHLRK